MFKNGLYNLVGAAIRLLLSVLSVPILLHFLGTAQYGLYAVIFSVVSFVSLFEGSVAVMVTVFLSKYVSSLESDHYRINNTVAISCRIVLLLVVSTALILWLSAPTITQFLGNLSPRDTQVGISSLRIAAFVVATRLMLQLFIGIEQGYGAFKLSNSITTAYNVGMTVTMLVAVAIKPQVTVLFTIQAFIGGLTVLVHAYVCVRRRYVIREMWTQKIDKIYAKEMISYGYKTYLGTIGSALFSQVDRIVVGRILGLEIAGVYAALTGVTMQINMLSAMPVQPLVYELSGRTAGGNDQVVLEKMYLQSVYINSLVALGLGGTIILVAPELIQLLFGENSQKFPEISFYLQVLAIIYSVYSLNATGFYSLLATQREGINTIISLSAGLFTLTAIATLSYHYGIYGAFIGNAGYITTISMLVVSSRILKISRNKLLTICIRFSAGLAAIVFATWNLNSTYARFICATIIGAILLRTFVAQRKTMPVD